MGSKCRKMIKHYEKCWKLSENCSIVEKIVNNYPKLLKKLAEMHKKYGKLIKKSRKNIEIWVKIEQKQFNIIETWAKN